MVILAVLTAGIAAPYLKADRYREQIRRALEAALNRHVTVGDAHFNLFRGPGFSVRDVLIDDDPAAGIEPFAHVEILQARIHILSLLTGHLAFSNLRLVEPTVNLVKTTSGFWNFQRLLDRVPEENAHSAVPELVISSGRLNFKFGDTKSVFYINGADLDVYPAERGRLVLRFSGEPARTDHTAQGLGRLVARGVLLSKPGAEDRLDMSLQIERTAITELQRLVDAQDSGVRGFVASNMKLSGPFSHVGISGDLRIADIHRWDLMPNRSAAWTLSYNGFVDLHRQRIEVNTSPVEHQIAPVTVRFDAENYLGQAKWTASLALHDLPAGSLLDTARHMGAPFPEGAVVDGAVNGEIGYSRPDGLQGSLALTGASVKFPGGGTVAFERAPITLGSGGGRFGPAEVRLENGHTASLEARYQLDGRATIFNIGTEVLSISETKSLAERLLGVSSIPFLAKCYQGSWNGAMSFERSEDSAGVWTGDYGLQSTTIEVPGLASPLRIASAEVRVDKDQIQINRLRARLGELSIEGDHRQFLEPGRTDHFRIVVAEAQIGELERLFLPTLRRQRGFFARFQNAAKLPEWLKERQTEGTIQIRNLRQGDTELGSARARVIWNGAIVQFPNIETHFKEMNGAGKMTVNLAGALPQYRLSGRLRDIGYRDGTLDIDGALETSGIGPALLRNARADGTFNGTDIALAPDAQVDEIAGEFRLEPSTIGPRLALSRVQLTQGQDVLHGQAVSQPDGRIVFELTSGHKQVRLSGMLLPVHSTASVP